MQYFQKEYQWFNDLVKLAYYKKPWPLSLVTIVGGRFSGKSTAVQVFIALLCQIEHINLGIVFFRASKEMAKELFDDIVSTLQSFDFQFKSVASRLEITINKTTFKVIGLNSMSSYTAKKSGFARFANVDYIIKIFEECFEFSPTDYKAINEAIRHNKMSNKTPSYITFRVCNPWARNNWVIEECERFQPFRMEILKETGNQIGIYDYYDQETQLSTKMLFQYTNWRVVREHLSDNQILTIKQYWQTDKNRALVADYGMPGFEFGAIYTSELHKIAEPFYSSDPCYFLVGMDYGWSQTKEHGKTAVVFATGSPSNGIDIYSEFVWDNSQIPIEPNQLCQRVINFIKNEVEDWMYKMNEIYKPNINVRVDNSNVGIIALLNNTAAQYGYHKWLSFSPCKKYPTEDRISAVLALLGSGKFRVNQVRCKNLIRELEFSHYDDKGDKKRIKENDHSINAMEYGFEPIMHKWFNSLGVDAKLLRRKYEHV